MKLATIVIPTYRRPDRITRAVNSALLQSYPDIEVIVVDDNGKDSEYASQTKKALQDFLDKDLIIYIQNDQNRGGSFSRNQGLNIAQGKYITFLDDDDEIASTKIAKQIQRLESLDDSYSCVYTSYHKVMTDEKIYYSNEIIEGDVYKYALSRSIYVGSGSNLLVKTSIAKSIGGYDIRFKRNQDLEFMTRLLKGYKLAYVDQDLMTIHYEIRETQRSYQELVDIDNFYYTMFKDEIENLTMDEQRKICSVFALERFRYSINKNIVDGTKNLLKNRVSLIMIIRYFFYIMDRLIHKKSYGFKMR
ncbi:MAG: glycosyltransferase family 2 protein [Erysipelotrichaceae bacterium]